MNVTHLNELEEDNIIDDSDHPRYMARMSVLAFSEICQTFELVPKDRPELDSWLSRLNEWIENLGNCVSYDIITYQEYPHLEHPTYMILFYNEEYDEEFFEEFKLVWC